jgi:hypothetical protein
MIIDTLPLKIRRAAARASLWEGCFSASGLEGTLVAPETGYNRMALSIFAVFWDKKPAEPMAEEFARHNWQVFRILGFNRFHAPA